MQQGLMQKKIAKLIKHALVYSRVCCVNYQVDPVSVETCSVMQLPLISSVPHLLIVVDHQSTALTPEGHL